MVAFSLERVGMPVYDAAMVRERVGMPVYDAAMVRERVGMPVYDVAMVSCKKVASTNVKVQVPNILAEG